MTEMRRGTQTVSQMLDDGLCHNFSHMACLVSLICTKGQLYGSWGDAAIRLYIWELSVRNPLRHIKATEYTESSFCC